MDGFSSRGTEPFELRNITQLRRTEESVLHDPAAAAATGSTKPIRFWSDAIPSGAPPICECDSNAAISCRAAPYGNVPFVAIKKAPKFGVLVETNLTRVYTMPFDHFMT